MATLGLGFVRWDGWDYTEHVLRIIFRPRLGNVGKLMEVGGRSCVTHIVRQVLGATALEGLRTSPAISGNHEPWGEELHDCSMACRCEPYAPFQN